MSVLVSGYGCEDPALLYHSFPDGADRWLGTANLFRVPLGRGHGRGHVLLKKSTLDALALTADHTLTFSGTDTSHAVPLQSITLLSRECVTPGSATDPDAIFLCECVDRRYHLRRVPVDTCYNVRAADGTARLSSSLNAGSPWTWQEIVNNLSNTTLGIGTLTLPFTPDATPEDLTYFAPWNAWDALCDVLDRVACAVEYDPVAGTFGVRRLGSADTTWAAAEAALDAERVWDGYCAEEVRGWRPEKVRVLFPRRPQPKGGTGPYYSVDVTLTATTGVVAGSYVQLHDDLAALGATGSPSNAAACATRAAERAADWLRSRGGFERPLLRVYRNFVYGGGPAALLGGLIGEVVYTDDGGVMRTVVRAGSTDDLERWHPLAPAPYTEPGTTGGYPDLGDGPNSIAPPATTITNSVPTFTSGGNVQTTPLQVTTTSDTSTLIQYGLSPPTAATTAQLQTIVTESATPQFQLIWNPDGTGSNDQFQLTATGGATDQVQFVVDPGQTGTDVYQLLVAPTYLQQQYVFGGVTIQEKVAQPAANNLQFQLGIPANNQGFQQQFQVAGANIDQAQFQVGVYDGASTVNKAITYTAAAGVITAAVPSGLNQTVAGNVTHTGTLDASGATLVGIARVWSSALVLAAGSVQGDATAISTNQVQVQGADGTKGVILFDMSEPRTPLCVVWNDGASALKVYPPSGEEIDNGGANVAKSIAADTAYLFHQTGATEWRSVLLSGASAGTYLLAANNLSDVASAGTARTNLGLGTAATQNTGTSGATVPLLNGNNTHSGSNTFTGSVTVSSATPFVTLTDTDTSARGVITGSDSGSMYYSADPDNARGGSSHQWIIDAVTHMVLDASSLNPGTNDSHSLGTATVSWSDLFLASGGVINWDNGNVTLTHSAGLLTSSAPLSLGTSNALTCGSIELGNTSDATITRTGAGAIAVEGVGVVLATRTLTAAGLVTGGGDLSANRTFTVTAATQSDQETGTSTTTAVTPSVQHYHPSAAKAWVNFKGTGTVTIRASYNVSSITDNGTGDYTINFSTGFSSANYGFALSVGVGASAATAYEITGPNASDPTASAFRIATVTPGFGAGADAEFVGACFFGDQ